LFDVNGGGSPRDGAEVDGVLLGSVGGPVGRGGGGGALGPPPGGGGGGGTDLGAEELGREGILGVRPGSGGAA
jgi:hypothetical protein